MRRLSSACFIVAELIEILYPVADWLLLLSAVAIGIAAG